MNYVTVDRDADVQFARQRDDEPVHHHFKYFPVPALAIEITESIEVDILVDATNVVQKAVE